MTRVDGLSHDDRELHDHDRGLEFDLATLWERRRLLGLIAGLGFASLVGCASGSTRSGNRNTTSGSSEATTSGASCAEIPEETAGPSLAQGTTAGNKIATSQLALPAAVCQSVYATDGYTASLRNLAQTALETDNAFRDGYGSQLAKVTGDVSSGYVASLTVPV